MDKTNSGRLKRSEFIWGIKEAGENLNKRDSSSYF